MAFSHRSVQQQNAFFVPSQVKSSQVWVVRILNVVSETTSTAPPLESFVSRHNACFQVCSRGAAHPYSGTSASGANP